MKHLLEYKSEKKPSGLGFENMCLKFASCLAAMLLAVFLTAGTAKADDDIPSGLTYGVSLGWFGQVAEGQLNQSGFAIGGNVGLKVLNFGLSLDGDISVNPTEHTNYNLWTYSGHLLLMGYVPLNDFAMVTFGAGPGGTGWSLDYEYSTHELHYNWYVGYYVEDNDYSETIDDGGFFSLKFKVRFDLVALGYMLGIEFDWIPWIDTEHGKGIVNNMIGVQIHLGGID